MCVVALTGCLTAQTTWIVDASNGAGTNFTSLADAVAAASPGDILLVRSGFYTGGITTSKGLTILGQPTFQLSSGILPSLTISNMPANQTFVIANCASFLNAGAAFIVMNADGRVHFQQVSGSAGGSTTVFSAIQIVSSPDVTFTNCAFSGNPAASVVSSNTTFAGGSLAGVDSFSFFGGTQTASGHGLDTIDSTVALSQVEITGGNGGINPFGVPPFNEQPGRPGISARRSTIVVTGTDDEFVRAGTDPASRPVPAISAIRGTLDVDPVVGLQPQHGGEEVSGSTALTERRIVSLLATGGQLPPVVGGRVDIQVSSPAGDLVAIFVGAPIQPLASPFGPIHIDLATAVAVVFGAVQPASELTRFGFTVPNIPALEGIVLGAQAANFYQSNAAIEMSNVGIVVIR